MTNDKPIHILDRLEKGFRTDSAHLKEMETDLAGSLNSARQFGRKHGSPDNWNTNWHEQWDNVEGRLRRIRELVNEMHDFIESSDRGRLQSAVETWENIQSEDTKLVEALGSIRAQASALDAAVRKDWNVLASTLEPHFETVYACAQALRVKVELLKEHSKERVDHLVQGILSKLPNRSHADGWDAVTYTQEYAKAVLQLEHEQHEFMGFLDVVKSLFMWVETPSDRVRKNRLLRVDEA